MAPNRRSWITELERWLEPFVAGLGHKARRRMCPLYIAGLIGPGDRKSVQPMAERLAPGQYDQLHHFVAEAIWETAPLEAELLVQADRLVGGKEAVLVIDDTALPKKGTRSVGVAPQYASALGKTANCQTLVSLTLARGEVPVMVGLRLFLPESWTSDPAAMKRARVPADRQVFRSKPEIAIEEIDRIRAGGARFGCVLADAGYGLSAPFRHALSERSLRWAVGIPRHQKVYPADVSLVFPVAGRGRPRKRYIPDSKSMAAASILADAPWRSITWRRGTKGRLSARFAAVRVRVADGPRSALATWVPNTCPARKSGWSANVVPAESRNTICQTCRLTRQSKRSPLPSRRGGSASRRISSSRKSSASTTSKDAHGRACTVMR
jgi:SRSO17 transposase